MTTKLQAWLSTGRISNIPTVWCNCLVLLFLLLPARLPFTIAYIDSFALWIILSASTFIYIGGCFLGDSFDVPFDRQHNPNRPIPAGVLNQKSVLTASILLLLGGIGITLLTSFLPKALPETEEAFRLFQPEVSVYAASVLVGIIILYSWLHKRSAWFSLSLIGACRLFLIGYSATFLTSYQNPNALTFWSYLLDSPAVTLVALAVGLYTVCFASVARLEHTNRGIRWANVLELCMLALPLPYLIYFYSNAPLSQNTPWLSLICLIFYGSWMYKAFRALPHSKGIFVSQCLSGFCLLDACFLSTSGLGPVLIAMFLFIGANLLQKIASAT